MMSKLLYYPMVLTFLTGIFFLMQTFEQSEERILYRNISADDKSGKDLLADTLSQNTKTDLFVLPSPEREVFWRIATPTADTLHLIEYTQPFAFNEAGTYHIEAYHKLRKVGASTVHIPESAFVKFELASARLIEGEALLARDVSTAKAEARRWRLTVATNDVSLNDPEDADEFNWTAAKNGDYTLHLEYLDAEGNVAFYESKDIEVIAKSAPVKTTAPTPKPKREASADEMLAAKQKQAEKDRLKKEKQEADALRKKEEEEKARLEREEKDRASMPSWYDHSSGAQFTAGPTTPEDRREVTFKSGMTVFTLKAKADFALTSLHYWGNFNTGNVTIDMECLTCSTQKKLRAFKFLSGQGTNLANERSVASGKGFVKGHTYKVTVTMEEETELGFVKLSKLQWNDQYMELKFETSETPVYGLTFQKR